MRLVEIGYIYYIVADVKTLYSRQSQKDRSFYLSIYLADVVVVIGLS